MKIKLRLFESKEFGTACIMNTDRKPWFLGMNIANALGYGKSENALKRGVEGDDSVKRGVTDSHLPETFDPTLIMR